MSEVFRYAAFISYSSKDAVFAQKLHRALESYGIPSSVGEFDLLDGAGKRNRIYPVFRDREELAAGSLGERIAESLKASRALIVVCSPNAAASPWVEAEIQSFLALGRRERVFAIVAAAAPLFDAKGADATLSCFPPAFREVALTNAKALEPLAADARKGKDGFRNALLKIVAGLIGVTPGQLIDRDRKLRRERMLRAAVVAVLAIVGIGAGFAYQRELVPVWAKYVRYWGRAETADALSAMKPGETFQDCSDGSKDCPVMVVVPAGDFLMGDADARSSDEHPERKISVKRFAVSKNEVTFEDWEACVAGGGCQSQATPGDSGWGRGRRPVINVSWDDAHEYTKWLSAMTGADYRLLSEAEWEYVARAGSADRYSWGDDIGKNEANCDSCGSQWENQMTAPVGSFAANPFGLYDLHGNVWEWVQDHYAGYDPAKTDASPVEFKDDRSSTSERVIRGGSWFNNPHYLGSAKRLHIMPVSRQDDVGFRLARMLP